MIDLFIGYATTDLSLLASGTLIIFVLLMGVKPQMVCLSLLLNLFKRHFISLVMCDK
jgi:hypothetical protein